MAPGEGHDLALFVAADFYLKPVLKPKPEKEAL
jgi:hypothetical protein